MDSITFVGSWVTFIFFVLLWFVAVIFLAKNGWLFASDKMGVIAGIFYTIGSGFLFALFAVAIILSHVEIN